MSKTSAATWSSQGAFTKTLSTGGPTTALLWQHQVPIGMATLVDTGSALAVTGKLSWVFRRAKDALHFAQDGVVQGLSIGFESLKEEYRR